MPPERPRESFMATPLSAEGHIYVDSDEMGRPSSPSRRAILLPQTIRCSLAVATPPSILRHCRPSELHGGARGRRFLRGLRTVSRTPQHIVLPPSAFCRPDAKNADVSASMELRGHSTRARLMARRRSRLIKSDIAPHKMFSQLQQGRRMLRSTMPSESGVSVNYQRHHATA